jgi:hypothetical protein
MILIASILLGLFMIPSLITVRRNPYMRIDDQPMVKKMPSAGHSREHSAAKSVA